MQSKKSEIWVGLFLLLALIAALFLCLRAANLKSFGTEPTWKLYATFDNIGGLKVNAPIEIGGVVIGRVTNISLDDSTLSPKVTMAIDDTYAGKIPDTSSLAVRTQGLLGEQFLALNLGFNDPDLGSAILKNGDTLRDTKSAIVLEDLIGQFLYKNGDSSKGQEASPSANEPAAAPTPTH